MFLALATIRHVAVACAVIRGLLWRSDEIPSLCRDRRAGFLVLRTRHLVCFAKSSIDGMKLGLKDRLAAMRGHPTSVEVI